MVSQAPAGPRRMRNGHQGRPPAVGASVAPELGCQPQGGGDSRSGSLDVYVLGRTPTDIIGHEQQGVAAATNGSHGLPAGR